MSYNARSGSGYGNNRKGSRFFHSGKKQKIADQIAQEKQRLEKMIAAGEVGDMSYVHGAIDAYTKVENMIPLDSTNQSLVLSLVGGDEFALQSIEDLIRQGKSEEDALKIYANGVEGDGSQLPPKLAQYAKQKGWLDGWEYPIEP